MFLSESPAGVCSNKTFVLVSNCQPPALTEHYLEAPRCAIDFGGPYSLKKYKNGPNNMPWFEGEQGQLCHQELQQAGHPRLLHPFERKIVTG